MKNTKSLIVFLLILAVVIAIAGFVRLRNQKIVSQLELQLPATSNIASRVQTTNQYLAPSARPLFGKASLSEEEKRILYKPFENLYGFQEAGIGMVKVFDEYKTTPKAYKVGMICLKHRLTRAEVMELISTPPNEDRVVYTNLVDVTYRFGINKGLIFRFDIKGNLLNTEGDGVHSWYEFPPLEEVKSDTSIEPPEPPPRPAIYRIIDEKIRADILKQSTPARGATP